MTLVLDIWRNKNFELVYETPNGKGLAKLGNTVAETKWETFVFYLIQ